MNQVDLPRDEALLWSGLLDAVAEGGQRLVLETGTGQRVVLISEAELTDLLVAARPFGGIARASMTAREREVLQLVAEGLTGTAIAARLGLATNTVAQHLSAVRRKFGVRSSAAAVDAARAAGQLEPLDP